MEFIIALFVLIAALAVLDAAALTWGVDSREGLSDDRVRLAWRPRHHLDARLFSVRWPNPKPSSNARAGPHSSKCSSPASMRASPLTQSCEPSIRKRTLRPPSVV